MYATRRLGTKMPYLHNEMGHCSLLKNFQTIIVVKISIAGFYAELYRTGP